MAKLRNRSNLPGADLRLPNTATGTGARQAHGAIGGPTARGPLRQTGLSAWSYGPDRRTVHTRGSAEIPRTHQRNRVA